MLGGQHSTGHLGRTLEVLGERRLIVNYRLHEKDVGVWGVVLVAPVAIRCMCTKDVMIRDQRDGFGRPGQIMANSC